MSSKVVISRARLDALADAIAGKTGVEDTYTIDEMIDAVENLEVSGSGDQVSLSSSNIPASASNVTLVDKSAIDENIFAFTVDGVTTVSASRIYIGEDTDELNISLPVAADDPEYRNRFGKPISYSASANVEVEQSPGTYIVRPGLVSIDGGTNSIKVTQPGYYTFQLTYPV